MQQIKKRQIHAQAKGQEHSAIDELESRIVQQENEISSMETRNFFSLHCAQLETQLVHANLNIIHIALKSFVASQVVEHEGVSLCKNVVLFTVYLCHIFRGTLNMKKW